MVKPYFLMGLAAVSLGLAATDLTSAQAATWHAGTPKALRHTWFHNGKGDNKAYITYSKTKSTGNLFGLDEGSERYYRLPGYGLKKLKYRSLGTTFISYQAFNIRPRVVKSSLMGSG